LISILAQGMAPGARSALFATAIRNLATATLAAGVRDDAGHLLPECRGLAPHLLPADAAPVAAHLLEALGKTTRHQDVAMIGSMLALVAGKLDREQARKYAGSAARRIVETVEKASPAAGLLRLDAALKELSGLLEREEVRTTATRLLALLPRAGDSQ